MKMIKRILLTSILIFGFLSCKNLKSEEKPQDSHKGFSDIIDDYINNNPLKLPPARPVGEDGFSHPLYQLYFDRNGNDTIVSIVQTPSFNDLKLEGYQTSDDPNTMNFDALDPEGFMLYKEKVPLVIFDEYEIGRKFYDKKKLSKVPDSLKFNDENYHIKFVRWDYRISNGKIFSRINE